MGIAKMIVLDLHDGIAGTPESFAAQEDGLPFEAYVR
jgi:hypothetical protein